MREDVDRLKTTIDGLDAQRVNLGEKFKRSHETLKETEIRAKKAEEELKMVTEAQQSNGTSGSERPSFLLNFFERMGRIRMRTISPKHLKSNAIAYSKSAMR